MILYFAKASRKTLLSSEKLETDAVTVQSQTKILGYKRHVDDELICSSEKFQNRRV